MNRVAQRLTGLLGALALFASLQAGAQTAPKAVAAAVPAKAAAPAPSTVRKGASPARASVAPGAARSGGAGHSRKASTSASGAVAPVRAGAVKAASLGPAVGLGQLQRGCLAASTAARLESELGLPPRELESLVGPQTEPGEVAWAQPGCVPFAYLLAPDAAAGGLALAPLTGSGQERLALMVSRAGAGLEPVSSWQPLRADPGQDGELWLPLASLGQPDGALPDRLPSHVLRDIVVLARLMKQHAGADDTAWIRVVLDPEGAEQTRVLAMEMLDPRTGRVFDSAVWVDRGDEPGAYISARGIEYEQMIWQAAVEYRRISRGVGRGSPVVVRQRVTAKAKPGGKPRVAVRAFRLRGPHIGIDFAAPMGTPVVSVADGEIVFAGPKGGYGNLLIVQHGSELTTYYAHLSAFTPGIEEGTRVRRGQEIGLVGSTGHSTGPHLHFEIRKAGQYINPADPQQSLPVWGLKPEERQAFLSRLLWVEASREQGMLRAALLPGLPRATLAARDTGPLLADRPAGN